VSDVIYIEGGGDSKDLRTQCRKGFRKLLEKCDFAGRMPKLVACGSRNGAFDDFRTAHSRNSGESYVAMLIDSEEPVADIEATWTHLGNRDNWQRPANAHDEQVLFMTTCMETWIVADRAVLFEHYGHDLQESALPSLVEIEKRPRVAVQDALIHATRNCTNKYSKGSRSFEVLAKLSPSVLKQNLPSFGRCTRILAERC
jgi:hypothetical protein